MYELARIHTIQVAYNKAYTTVSLSITMLVGLAVTRIWESNNSLNTSHYLWPYYKAMVWYYSRYNIYENITLHNVWKYLDKGHIYLILLGFIISYITLSTTDGSYSCWPCYSSHHQRIITISNHQAQSRNLVDVLLWFISAR